ncbi:Glycosyltransferase [Candidatus Regiella insecticola 5.15]|uniref:Glycosyltransferase n=1 Tax=Candidatus Regiella insecticola 5.15 TaxID=1005043 RepID=G2GXI0_9ENTR|nr:TcdA/TcdB catalytic glycosyltransferase domain-containing protein [Candidatus Regiella insecticola]EGY29542.1 Glycosyltransferase [Candidatus Regiella insecticola 5.15]
MTERNSHESSGIENNNQRHDYNEIKKAQTHYQEQLNSIQNSLEEWELLKEINQKIHRYIEKYPLVGSDEVEHLRSEEIKQLLAQNQQRNRELAIMPELRREIPKKIHFVWLGKLGTIQQEYIRAWNEINKGENYTITIWYDKDALLVHELNKRIKAFAKKINQLNFTPDAYANAVIVIQNQAYQKITEALERGLTFDQASINFIRDYLKGDEQELRNIKKQNQASFDDFILNERKAGRHYTLKNVKSLFDIDPHNPNPVQDREIQIQQKNYQLELALRQNMAAASDMLRLKVLEQQGGGYFDADLLPAFKADLWENLEIPAALSKSDLNDTDFNLAKTQLVLEHLSEFFPHRKMLFDSNKYQDYAKSFAAKGSAHKKLIDDMRIFLRGKRNTLSDFFQPLQPIKLHPDGILVAKNRDVFINNNAIFSYPNSGSIKLLQQQIGNNYRFLRDHDLVFVDNTDVINDRINNYTDKITLALWNDPKASTRINGEIGNMLFRKDGVVPGSQATIFISGPEMFERRIKRYSEQMFGQQRNPLSSSAEASFFISGLFSDFNNFTEEDMVSSWIQETEASSQTLLIKRSDQLKEWSALDIQNKPHQGNANQEKLYNDIRHHFDTLFLENTDKKILKNIFSLQLKIQSYINNYPKFPSVAALKELQKKIHNIVFPDADFKLNQQRSIIIISKIDPEQAARIYMSIHDHNKYGKAEPNINALIFSDPYLQPFKGFTGEENDIFQGKQGDFNAKFHIPLGNKFTVFKANLLAAQAQNVLNNVYLDEKKIAHIGYSYNELTALKGNEHVGIIIYTIILAIQEKRDSNFIGQTDLLMLKNFANQRYLQDMQRERLADINQIGKSDPNTEIAEWDKHYSGQTGEQLQQRLLDKNLNINSWLDVLLENRKGLLISENNYGLDFVTRHLIGLKSKGITTIGLGVLNAKFAQPLIDDYLRTGNLSGELAVMVETNGLGKLFESAFAKKMKIIALGVDSRRKGIEEDDYENIYRIDKTNQGVVEAFNQPGGKFVAILSSEFLQSQPGIEGPLSGITHRLGLPALTANESGFTWLADNIYQRKAYQPLSLNSIEQSASFPHFSVTADPGYQNILSTLDELHARVSNSGKINTACQLHQEIQQYIQRNPDSELNSRLITLKKQIAALFPSVELPFSPGRGQKRKMPSAIFDSHGSREGNT